MTVIAVMALLAGLGLAWVSLKTDGPADEAAVVFWLPPLVVLLWAVLS